MTMNIINGDCLKLMKELPDKSVDLFICDLPYGETNCKWDSVIDLDEFWKEFKRLRKSKRTACIHFCSTKFGYTLIKSNEKMFKMDMVWKKRNKTGGLQSRHRPMRNHEMVYFFYEQAPQYNRDKYHKRIQAVPKFEKDNKNVYGNNKDKNTQGTNSFKPPNPASVLEEDIYGEDKKDQKIRRKKMYKKTGNVNSFEPPNPASVIEDEQDVWGETKFSCGGDCGRLNEDGSYKLGYEPPNPASVYESTKVFIGKRHHQTEKPLDILEFFIKYWSDEGHTILDPTMGSGSTGVACKNLKRNFIGYEMNEKIFNVAKNRINKPPPNKINKNKNLNLKKVI